MTRSKKGTAARARCLAGLLASVSLAAAGAVCAAQPSRPDFTGVWEVAPSFGGGARGGPPQAPEYNAEYKARHAAIQERIKSGKLDIGALCTPPGVPSVIGMIGLFEILDAPNGLRILYEYESHIRRIYTDGRGHPPEPDPTLNGDSVGRYEGQELVIDTVALKDSTFIENSGLPHSDAMHVVERMRMRGADTLEIAVTVEDPKALTKPYTKTFTANRVPNGVLLDYECNENQRYRINPDGSVSLTMQ